MCYILCSYNKGGQRRESVEKIVKKKNCIYSIEKISICKFKTSVVQGSSVQTLPECSIMCVCVSPMFLNSLYFTTIGGGG